MVCHMHSRHCFFLLSLWYLLQTSMLSLVVSTSSITESILTLNFFSTISLISSISEEFAQSIPHRTLSQSIWKALLAFTARIYETFPFGTFVKSVTWKLNLQSVNGYIVPALVFYHSMHVICLCQVHHYYGIGQLNNTF